MNDLGSDTYLQELVIWKNMDVNDIINTINDDVTIVKLTKIGRSGSLIDCIFTDDTDLCDDIWNKLMIFNNVMMFKQKLLF